MVAMVISELQFITKLEIFPATDPSTLTAWNSFSKLTIENWKKKTANHKYIYNQVNFVF